jgi:hypothetical protein
VIPIIKSPFTRVRAAGASLAVCGALALGTLAQAGVSSVPDETSSVRIEAVSALPRNGASPAVEPQLDPGNYWFSSFSQGLGIMSPAQWDLEANLYGMTSRQSGLGAAPTNGGGLQDGQLSLRRQIASVPGLDLGFTAGGTYLRQGTDSGTVSSRGATGFLTSHYAMKLHQGLGAGLYLQAGEAATQQSDSPGWSSTAVAAASPVLAWEPDNSFINSLALNPATVSFAKSGALSQGPALANLIGVGVNFGLAVTVSDTNVLLPEISYVHSHGSAIAPGAPSAASDTYRAGIVETLSFAGRRANSPQTNSVSVGIWYYQEVGKVATVPGQFTTRGLQMGFTVGCRRATL